MDLELIIRSSKSGIDFALLRDGRLIELHKEDLKTSFSVGDIFLAKTKKVLGGLNAIFVGVGSERDGFLHYQDLGPQFLTMNNFLSRTIKRGGENTLQDVVLGKDISKKGRIEDIFKTKQQILVQVIKEPISTKGPRLTSEISLAGRYMVLLPFSKRISVSQKIGNRKEKERLRKLVKSICPPGFGIILRTFSKGKKVAELDYDLQQLLNKWQGICRELKNKRPPVQVFSELNRVSSMLRDLFSDDFTSIVVNDEALYKEIDAYLKEIDSDKKDILKLYNYKKPIFDKYYIERQIKTSFGKTVSMARGAYLVIEHTEALHVIDVNSGNRSNKESTQEDNAFNVNLIAAKEIARQLRLRDMGGIIVVDFIDLKSKEKRDGLYRELKAQMALDRTKHKILPPTKFGLIQITRQRVRAEIAIPTQEEDPNSNRMVEAPIVMVDRIENELDHIIANNKHQGKRISLHIHSFIAAYLKKGLFSKRFKWFFTYKKWIRIYPRDGYKYLTFRFKFG